MLEKDRLRREELTTYIANLIREMSLIRCEVLNRNSRKQECSCFTLSAKVIADDKSHLQIITKQEELKALNAKASKLETRQDYDLWLKRFELKREIKRLKAERAAQKKDD